MIGTFTNFFAIVIGSLIGLIFKKGIPQRISNTIMHGVALCVIFIGISGTLKGDNTLLMIISIVIGALIGELLDLDKQLNKLGKTLESKLKGKNGKVAEGFVTASLLFCVGAMAIVGALESGLQGNHKILYAKSMLDGISAIVFSSSLGIGVIFSSIVVLIYQGIITIAASFLKGILIQSVINNMTAVGSLLIMALGFNMIGASKIKAANLLPAVFIPIIYQIIINILG